VPFTDLKRKKSITFQLFTDLSYKRLSLLSDLLNILSKKEYTNLKHYLSAYHSKNGVYEPKTVGLVELIRIERIESYSVLKEKICPESSEKTFNVLVHRCYGKALESLTLPLNTNNPELYSTVWSTRFSLNQKLGAAQILIGRGKRKLGSELLNSIVKESQKYELFDIQVAALTEQMNQFYLSGKSQKVQVNSLKIEGINIKKNFIFQAKSTHFFDLNQEKVKLHGLNLVDVVEQRIIEIESWLENHYSANLKFWYYKIRLNYLEYTLDHEGCLNEAKEFQKFLNENVAIKTRKRLETAQLHITQSLIALHKLDEAILYCKKMDKAVMNKQSPHALLNKEFLFVSFLHTGNIKSALRIVNELIQNVDSTNSMDEAKYHYYKSCIFFSLGDYIKCNEELDDTKYLDKDKEGWNINVRILAILNQIQMNHLDLADQLIDRLNKHIKETSKTVKVNARYATILDCLQILRSSGFEFRLALPAVSKKLDDLESLNSIYSATILQDEFIDFSKWYRSKISPIVYENIMIAFAA